MKTCTQKKCQRRPFMDSDRCFDHQSSGIGLGFAIWFAFCALLSIAIMCGIGWAVYELVTWVTSK